MEDEPSVLRLCRGCHLPQCLSLRTCFSLPPKMRHLHLRRPLAASNSVTSFEHWLHTPFPGRLPSPQARHSPHTHPDHFLTQNPQGPTFPCSPAGHSSAASPRSSLNFYLVFPQSTLSLSFTQRGRSKSMGSNKPSHGPGVDQILTPAGS